MFEVGWTEMLVIAIVMIVVVGPKDLPNMLRTFGRMAAKARGMANDFRRQFDEALKEAELDDVKKSVDALRGLNPATEIKKQLNPFEKAAADVRAGIDNAMKPKPAAEPTVAAADAPAEPAEPLKNGATDMPGVAGPDAMPAAPSVVPAKADAAAPAAKAKGGAKAAKAPAAKPAKDAAPLGKPSAKPAPKPAAKAAPNGSTARTAANAAAAKAPAAKPAKDAAPVGKPVAKLASKPAANVPAAKATANAPAAKAIKPSARKAPAAGTAKPGKAAPRKRADS